MTTMNTTDQPRAVACIRFVRLLRYWLRGRTIPTPWWADKLTLIWTWRAVPLSTINKFCEPDGRMKRGFVVRRIGIYLTGPAYHDLWWYRSHIKLRRRYEANKEARQPSISEV